MSVALKFQGAYTPPVGTVLLKFSATVNAGHDLSFSFESTLGSPGGSLTLRHVSEVCFSVTFGAPAGTITIDYDANVFRGASASHGGAWQEAIAAPAVVAPAWRDAPRRRRSARAAWEEAARCTTRAGAQWRALDRASVRKALAWSYGRVQDAAAAPGWLAPPRKDTTDDVVWAWALPRRQSTDGAFSYPPRRDSARAVPWREAIVVPARMIGLPAGGAIWFTSGIEAPWQYAIQPPYGESIPPTHPVEPPDLYIPDLRLVFRCPPALAPWVLRFGKHPCGGGNVIVPVRRVYVVINSASLVRVSDGAQIPAAAVSLAIDTQSWAWELRATLAGKAALEMVRAIDGSPVEVEATINGQTWRAIIDAWQHSRSFGSRSITISGRSRAAYLAAPYTQPRTYTEANARNAQQLAAQELPIGWTLDWTLTDWLVPAGAWSYQGKTPIEAIVAIAGAAGGYLQAHQSDQTLIAASRYPAAPWDWATAQPDISLPIDVLTELGVQWQPITPANKVYVGGREQGVLVGVKRTGTAGDKNLPMIVDPLITEVAAARARGTAELADAERRSNNTMALPLDSSIAGLILPGNLLEVTGDAGGAWRGLVRGVSVSATVDRDALRVRQQLAVERHYAEAA